MTEGEKALAQMNWPSVQHLLYHMPSRSAAGINEWRRKQGLAPLPNRYTENVGYPKLKNYKYPRKKYDKSVRGRQPRQSANSASPSTGQDGDTQ